MGGSWNDPNPHDGKHGRCGCGQGYMQATIHKVDVGICHVSLQNGEIAMLSGSL